MPSQKSKLFRVSYASIAASSFSAGASSHELDSGALRTCVATLHINAAN